jgi:hypothetical protein
MLFFVAHYIKQANVVMDFDPIRNHEPVVWKERWEVEMLSRVGEEERYTTEWRDSNVSINMPWCD